MGVLFTSVLFGITSGLRALAGLAVLSWAARLGYVPLEHTWLAFLGFTYTPYILTLMAIGELANDTLPKTPSRLIPPQFITRVITGTLCGVGLGVSTGHVFLGLIGGALGSVTGTLAGAKARVFGARLFGRDLPAALSEDAVAIGIAVVAVRFLL